MEVVSAPNPIEEMDATYAHAREEAKRIGATKMVIVMCKDNHGLHTSKSFKTGSLKFSECVALLEIAKDDVLLEMRNG